MDAGARGLGLLLGALLLAGCATNATETATPTISATSTVTATPSTTPSPSPTPDTALGSAPEMVTVSLEEVRYEHDSTVEVAPLSEPAALVDLFGRVAGEVPEGENVDGWRQDVYNWDITKYDFDSLSVVIHNAGSDRAHASIGILDRKLNGVPIRTASGFAVGDSRAALIEAGAIDGWDRDGDGESDFLSLDAVPVEGVESLSRPGEIGTRFIDVEMDGDSVVRFQLPSNDFSDI